MTSKSKSNSRPARWSAACAKASVAVNDLREAVDELDSLRQEYEDWRDNLPESLQSSALGEKLEAICDLDFSALDDIETAVDEAENADLPRGFGRD